MLFAIYFILLSWIAFRMRVDELTRSQIMIGWLVKLLFGVSFVVIHSQVYGIGSETVDWEEYMQDSITLNQVAYTDFSAYLRFLFGFDSQADMAQFLANTNHWSAGDINLLDDAKNVLRLNNLIVFFSKGQVYIHVLVFAFLSFIGLIEIYRAFKNKIQIPKVFFWFALLFFPSLGFWSGSVLKEPFLMLGMALVLNGIFGQLTVLSRSWRLLLGTLLMIMFKPYVILVLLICLPIYFLGKKVFTRRVYLAPVSFALIGLLIFWGAEGYRNDVTQRLTRMQYDFMNVGRGGYHVEADSVYYYFTPEQKKDLVFLDSNYVSVSHDTKAKKIRPGMRYPFDDVMLRPNEGPWFLVFAGTKCGSYIELTYINQDAGQLLKNIPEAFFNAAFRPTFWDVGGKLKIVNFIETILLFGFLAISFWRRWRFRYIENSAEIWFMLSAAFMLFVLIGWTTPVIGALVRYRLPAYLLIFIVAMIALPVQKKET